MNKPDMGSHMQIPTNLWEREEDMSIRNCMLIITHACNLNCSYCYESHKDSQQMTFQTAQKVLEKEIELVEKSDIYQALMVEFMGGEPLMNFELIRQVVEWLENIQPSIPWHSFATTNATLLDTERKVWFHQHRESVTLGASYDGDDDMQQINRKSGNTIDLDYIHENWPYQEFRITISRETLPKLFQGIRYMALEKDFPFTAALAQGQDWTEEDVEIFYQQLNLLSDMYLEHPDLKVANLLNRPLTAVATVSGQDVQKRFCGSGKHMITYDVDGQEYGCHMFSPVVLGEGAVKLQDVDWNDDKLLADSFCNECLLKNLCPTCIGFNYRYRGDFASRDKRGCGMTLAQTLASCEFQIRYLSRYYDKLEDKDAENAKAALHVYPILKKIFYESRHAPYLR